MQRRSRDDEAQARVYGKRAALGICSVVAVWFIVASVAQIVPAVFGAGIVPARRWAARAPRSARAPRGLNEGRRASTPAAAPARPEGRRAEALGAGPAPSPPPGSTRWRPSRASGRPKNS